jgi:L,D-transpeptidase ErfK/SrfK
LPEFLFMMIEVMMPTHRSPSRFRSALGVAALASAVVLVGASPVPVWAQDLAINAAAGSAAAAVENENNALDRGRYAVLIDLDENRLYFKQGDETLWSAPVGTGTGMRVITHEDDWEFSTPTGKFQVQYKERDPVWIAPDWYFVENNLPVPARNHPSRYKTGTLGVAAVYISPSLAIHGTDKPELIGQRVSHGCIRLENRYAMRLFHNVQVGTEVIIVGGEEVKEKARVVDLREGYDPSLASKGGKKAAAVDRVYERWVEMETEELVGELDEQLEEVEDEEESRWDEIAMILVDRAQQEDDEAIGALHSRAGDLPTASMELEWGTFLIDVYRRAPEHTLEALASLDVEDRGRVAKMMVAASLTLYAGELDDPSAPWPTSRIPRDVLSRRAGRGWDSLAEAEGDHRSVIRTASAER